MKKYLYIFAVVIPVALFSVGLSPGTMSANRYNKVEDPNKPITIIQNTGDGRYLKLSNGEKWEVYKKDTVHSGGWLGGDLVIKKEDEYRRSGQKYYRYKIHNKATNDSVWARLLDADDDNDST